MPLTPEDITREWEAANEAFRRDSRGFMRWPVYWNYWLCRAQVKKLVEWLKKNNVAGDCYDSVLVDKWDLLLDSEVWEELQLRVFCVTEREETRQRMAALKAAGEGK
jgi:hypothetical protein